MRPLKFRAWNIVEKCFDDMGPFDLSEESGYFGDMICGHKNEILQQYTGLKDKNGKEIYEGDIIVFNGPNEWEKNQKAKVVFGEYHDCEDYLDSTHYGFYFKFINEDYRERATLKDLHSLVRVIGNIHENPELIPK